MSSPMPRRSKPTRLSPFFRDLASPIYPHRSAAGSFAAPGRVAASALWRETLPSYTVDPPPPPVFTLDDRADFSPEPGLGELSPPWPVSPTGARSLTPAPRSDRRGSLSPSPSLPSSSYVLRTRAEAGGSGTADGRGKSKVDEGERETPVDGAVEPGALIALPPPPQREIVRPALQGCGVPNGGVHADEWITVFGFSPGDTNLVLREFEKCGGIVKHVPGPRDGNWIHILYQNPYDAQKALKKNGMQLNSLLIIGVKPIDPMHRQHLKETLHRINHGGFMVSLPSKSTALHSSAAAKSSGSHPHSCLGATGAIATPANSVVSKLMDVMFGI